MHEGRLALSMMIVVLGSIGCGKVDSLLEGKVAPTDRIYIATPPGVSIPQGGEQTVTITVTRSGAFQGNVVFTADNVPDGVTPEFDGATISGETTTSAMRLRISTSVPVGSYSIRLRGRADPLPDAFAAITITVTAQPAFTLTPGATAVTVTHPGSAPLDVVIARTNFTGPIALSLSGATGISAQLSAATDTIHGSVVVASSVAAGSYPVTIRGVASGLADRSVPIAVTVIDGMQLIAPAPVTIPVGATSTAKAILNTGTYGGAVTVSAESLPSGVSVVAAPVASDGSILLAITVTASATPGSYAVTLRAHGTGTPDATTQLSLTISAASIAIAVQPSSVTLLPGSTVSTTLAITRQSYAGDVAIAIDNAPPGVTATAQPATVTGSSATIAIAASSSTAPTQYTLAVRGTPVGLGSAAAQTATLTVNVGVSSPDAGNVQLDWSACTGPDWVAYQDGTSQWTQVVGTGGRYRFSVASATGAFAYHDSSGVTVQMMSQGELAAKPLTLCAPRQGTKTIFGTGVHAGPTAGDVYTYAFGGAAATSTGIAPNFSLIGVQNGPQDLVAWGGSANPGRRGVIRRDLDIADGGSLAPVSLQATSSEPFSLALAAITVSGLSGANFSMSYLTTPACVANSMYSAFTPTMFGIPASEQRATDYHLMTVFLNAPTVNPTILRSTSITFHLLANRTVTLPPVVAAPPITSIPGAVKRLSAFLSDFHAFSNASVTFQFSDGTRAMTVRATSAAVGTSNVTLAMPDLSGVSGLPSGALMPATSAGKWSVTFDGASSNDPLCTEGLTTQRVVLLGTFD